jgi:hypothetical protein
MQLKILVFISLLFSIVSAHADSTTARLGLTIPTIGSPSWGLKVNNNFQILDSTVNTTGVGTGTPGGSTTQFQFNNSGVLGGSPDLTTTGAGNVTLTTMVVTNSSTFNNIGVMTINLSTMTFQAGTDLQLQYNSVTAGTLLGTDASGNVISGGAVPSYTIAQLTALVAPAGTLAYCSNCTVTSVCVSTSAVVNSFASLATKTTHCN